MREPTTTDLRDVLRARASSVAVPEPPLEAVVGRARSRRRSTAVRAVAGTAALAAAIAAVIALGGRSDESAPEPGPVKTPTSAPTPATIDDLPTGPPPKIAYLAGRTLHVGQRSFRFSTRASDLRQVGKLITVLDGSRVLLFRTDSPGLTPEVLTAQADGAAVISTDEQFVVWPLAPGSNGVTLVLHPLRGGPDRRATVPATPQCCDNPFELDGVTQEGVISSQPALGKVWIWLVLSDARTGAPMPRGVMEVTGFNRKKYPLVAQVTYDYLVLESTVGTLVAGGVDGQGRFVADSRMSVAQADFDDPETHRAAFWADDGIHVREWHQQDATDLVIATPHTEYGPDEVRWEDSDHVIAYFDLDVTPPGTEKAQTRSVLVRCSLDTEKCERAADLRGWVELPRQ